jgi:hypothetical protein
MRLVFSLATSGRQVTKQVLVPNFKGRRTARNQILHWPWGMQLQRKQLLVSASSPLTAVSSSHETFRTSTWVPKNREVVVEDEIPAPDVHNQDQDDVGGDRDKGDENITEVRDKFSCVIYSYCIHFRQFVPKALSFHQNLWFTTEYPTQIPIRSTEFITCRIRILFLHCSNCYR